jgi:hypothetical protein
MNLAHGEVYSIQLYVINFASDLVTVLWFSLGPPVSTIDKTDRHDITEIMLKVALNTITLTSNPTKESSLLLQFHCNPLR